MRRGAKAGTCAAVAFGVDEVVIEVVDFGVVVDRNVG